MPSETRVLIIDDEKDITSSLRIGLSHRGFKVETFNDPVHALSVYKPGSYDLIILDIRMPRMNGFEFFREVKKVDKGAKICFLTAFEVYTDEFKRLFPNMKVEGFLRKPIAIAELASQIQKMTS
jgi:two-component system, OmpR family, response regulator ChvI